MAESDSITWKKFEGPWGESTNLGCRNLFCADQLVFDLFEYGQSGPASEVKMGDTPAEETYEIGFTQESRVWRITFNRPFALRVRDHNIRRVQPQEIDLPGPCSFTEDSNWLREVQFDPRLQDFVPTHYIFVLLDDLIEILGSNQPSVEEVPNDLTEQP